MLRSPSAPKLLRAAGSFAIGAGLVVAAIAGATTGGRIAGLNLALAGGFVLVVARRARSRPGAPSFDAAPSADFFDGSSADRSFWPDGI